MYRLFIVLFFLSILHGEEKSEGVFGYWGFKGALDVISLFLPYNPTILLLGNLSDTYPKCIEKWPLATIYTSLNDKKIDFIWMNEALDPILCHKNALKNVKVLYKTGLVSSNHISNECAFLENKKFKLGAHWHNKGIFFLNKKLFDGFMKGHHYDPLQHHPQPLNESSSYLSNYLRKITNKSPRHQLPEIDYIYMINLDERPEKWELSLSYLQPYEIYPHRFSAVNGWKLSVQDLNRLGVVYQEGMGGQGCLGLVYREIEKKEYKNFEFIENPGATYFIPGMTKGGVGIVLSHLSILQDAYDSNYKTIWVMEDDIQIIDDPRQLSGLIQELDQTDPEWDILFTDIDSKDQMGNYAPCRAIAMRPNVLIEPLETFLQKFYRVNDHFSRTGMRYGAYSMIIRRSGVEKILDYYKKHAIFLPYDADFWLISSLKMYCTNKDIVSTIPNALTDNHQPNFKSVNLR